ncbi:sulfotransferase family protein [Gloeothece verrucosa]|uniref:Uncharacterized protein n=1 Tax=Gloeothece verrucosa (strain PCC 7822) TaxID=497965 RepID=E0UDJ8_GLOV7|nr:sulfotransferase [Gloeothece verrucosa]ADN15311.1 hypothetical protein Cyan7822_3361 [Gloeothece verrucosa PCC 7822]
MDYTPILVTGCSRSGSTWVGESIGLNKKLRYIYEPFNIDIKSPNRLKFPFQFMYINEENGAEYYQPIQKLLTTIPLKERLANFGQGKQRPLLKDPLAVFSAPWLNKQFQAKVVVTIRHPASIVSSRKKLGWRFNFKNFLQQSLLMQDYLEPLRSDLESLTKRDRDIIDESIMLWKVIYYVVDIYRHNHPDWLFIRHEDICADPLAAFKQIFAYLNITVSDSICQSILDSTSEKNPTEIPTATQHNLRRNSRSVSELWKSRLSATEIQRVRQETGELADKFYSEAEW